MNPLLEKIPETGIHRKKSISITSGGGPNLAGRKTRRHSIGITTSQKSSREEGNTVPNYLRASTGSCHDFCKFGNKHEHSKSTIPIKFKTTTTVEKDKVVPKTVVPLEKKKPSTKIEIQARVEPVKVSKKDVLFISSSKKPQVNKPSLSSTNGKTTKNEVKTVGEIKKKDIKTVKTINTGTIKKVVAKVTPNGSQSTKASLNRAASLKAEKPRVVKKVTPLKDQKIQNRMQKTKPKETIADKNVVEKEVKPETMEFDFTQSSTGLINPPVCNSSDSFSDKNVVEEEVKPETMEFDFMQLSTKLVNTPVCNSSDSSSDKNVADELPIIHPVHESSELFSDKEVLEDLAVAESSKSCSDKEVLEEEALIAPPVSESSESFYDDEVLENESDYTDDEEAEVSEDGSETANVSEMKASVGNQQIPRKGKMVISDDKNEQGVKLRFRRGKILDLQSENNTPRRLKFRRRVIDGNETGQNISRKTYKNKTLDVQSEIDIPRQLKFSKGKVMEGNEDKQRASRRSFEKKYVEEANESKNGPESVVLKHQIEQEKKDAQGLLNNVIEETASKLVESRKSKVKALVGAFETVISLQDGKPLSG
ncbi:uncharacterized protein LOC143596266 [Bidens hawaiensis]|uniref:uncharacterized protein LOC143596266 n=1 Tax=Bidens hawaiensis TaxID=980011 RepID=UPI0040495DC5